SPPVRLSGSWRFLLYALLGWLVVAADAHLDLVLAPIVHEVNDVFGAAAFVAHHGDAVGRLAVAVAQLEPGPARRQARHDAQLVAFAPEAEEGFHRQAVHPARRAGVPGPAAAADVR